jgi:carboxypeptidase Q
VRLDSTSHPLVMPRLALIAALLLPSVLLAQSPADRDVLAKIRTEGLEHSQVSLVFQTLTVEIGPRLTASPAFRRAVEFVRGRLVADGLENVHVEPWKFGRGWQLDRLTVEMTKPRYLPLIAYADAWSSSTKGDLEGAPIMIGGESPDKVEARRGQLTGAIVLTQPLTTSFVRKDRPQPSDPSYVPGSAAYATSGGRGANPDAARIAQTLRDAGTGLIIKPSIGEHGTVFVTGRDGGTGAVPSITMSAEHYNMIVRMLDHRVPVALKVGVASTFFDADQNAFNVIGEIPGSDPAVKDEVVMIGAHVDSWHTGLGATDNADGTTTVIEAMRILKAVGARPRRTIRVALWGGEEQGLLGSKAWVEQHLAGDANRAAREKFDVYFNIDNGTGPIYGFYLEKNPAVASIFDRWLEPLVGLGARRNVMDGIGATDHLSFINAGVPGFNPIQDYVNYDVRTHHTNMDTLERLDESDMREAAIVMASFAYNAAMADEKIPSAARR